MAGNHYRLRFTDDGRPYLLDCHRGNGIEPVAGCRFCVLLNRPEKPPAPGRWNPSQDKSGALKVRGGTDPMPEWGEAQALKVLAAAYGDQLARVVYTRCAKMAYTGPGGANARYHRRQDYVSIAALQAVEKPKLRQAKPGQVSNAVRNAIVDAERATSLNRRHLERVNGKEVWVNDLDTWLVSTQADDGGNSFFDTLTADSGNSLFDDLTAGLAWREGFGNPAEWQGQADTQVVDTARREYLLWQAQSRLDALQAEDLTGYWAFRLHEVEDRSYRAVGKALAIGPETARRACERVKQRFGLETRVAAKPMTQIEGSGRGSLWYGDPLCVLRGRLIQAL